jgi:hypothetical protein
MKVAGMSIWNSAFMRWWISDFFDKSTFELHRAKAFDFAVNVVALGAKGQGAHAGVWVAKALDCRLSKRPFDTTGWRSGRQG